MQDDFNYAPYNNTIFNLDLPVADNEFSSSVSNSSHNSKSQKSIKSPSVKSEGSDKSDHQPLKKAKDDMKSFKQSFKVEQTIKLISEE